jgi:hypothetical protein
MIVYNVTVKVNPEIHDEWLAWMKETHIPDVMATGLFTTYRMMRVIVNEDDGETYSIQYLAESMADVHRYQVNHAPDLQQEHAEKYDGKFVAFRTLLEEI